MKNKIFLLFVLLGLLSQAAFALDNEDVKEDLKASIYHNLKCCSCQAPFKECICPEVKQMKGYAEALIDALDKIIPKHPCYSSIRAFIHRYQIFEFSQRIFQIDKIILVKQKIFL